MIYAIKITAEPGQSLSNVKALISEITDRAIELELEVNISQQDDILIDEFEKVVCEEISKYFFVTVKPTELFKPNRKRHVAWARQICIKKMIYSITLDAAADRFHQTHANAMYGRDSVINMYESNVRYREMIQRIEERTKCKIY
jgi:chromosomal replication initiation ATPase DnaA